VRHFPFIWPKANQNDQRRMLRLIPTEANRTPSTKAEIMKNSKEGLRSAAEVHRRREGPAPSPVCDELEADAELRRNFEGRETMDEGAASPRRPCPRGLGATAAATSAPSERPHSGAAPSAPNGPRKGACATFAAAIAAVDPSPDSAD
jgi:hypothetical protein